MGFEQSTLIYIEENDKAEASIAAKGFADEEVKNRAYINALGAELALKYLTSENISINNIHNLHSVKKILEETDISDIMLPNIHIDVRVIFDENYIFIPKSHFEYNIVPDIYLVFNLAQDFSHVKFLGFFEPRLINKNNANDKYYFIEKEKLSSPVDLKNYIMNFNGNTTQSLSENEMEDSERIMIAMADNDITENDKKYLLSQLKKCADLRDKFIEFENFELLSFSAVNDSSIIKNETAVEEETEETFENISNINLDDLTDIGTIEELSDTFSDELSEPSLEDLSAATENTSESADNKDDNILGDIAALGTAAALGAGAAGAVEGLSDALDGIELAKDGLDIIDKGLELGIDALDTLTFDNTSESLSNEIETNSLKNEAADSTENISNDLDPLNLDNSLDLDGFEIGSTQPIEENTDESMSFDNIQTEITDDITDVQEENDLEKLSFDNIDTSEFEDTLETVENISDTQDTISFDNVQDLEDEIPNLETNDIDDNTLSFDNIEIEDLQAEDVTVSELSDDNKISFDNMEIGNIDDEIVNLPDSADVNLENTEDLMAGFAEELPELEDDNSVTSLDTQEDEILRDEKSFDETPVAEAAIADIPQDNNIDELIPDIADINVDNLDEIGIPLDNISTPDVEDISSNNLLDEIDNILNASEINAQQEVSQVPEVSETIESSDIPETSIEDIIGEPIAINDDAEVNSIPSVDEIIQQSISNNDDDEIASMIDELETKYLNEDSGLIEDTASEVIQETDSTDEKLGVLFNDSDSSSDDDDEIASLADIMDAQVIQEDKPVKTPGAALFNKSESSDKNKKMIIVAAALVAVVASASVFTFLKSKSSNADIDNLAQNPVENDITNQNLTPLPTEEINDSAENLMTNTPDINSIDKKNIQTNQTSKELKSAALAPKPASSESYLSVQKLVWDVPDYLSYSPKMKNYLTTAGKSIKLSLSADLLLATEYAYSNQVKINLKLSNDGTIQNSQIVTSSGSEQIDKIVLQSVKDTLNVVKPPSGEVKGSDFNLSLIIYF